MDKRTFLKTSLLLGTGALLHQRVFSSISVDSAVGEFVQEPLGYEYDSLEPFIDAQTMELHYSKHHAGYTRKFNAAVKEEDLTAKSIEEIFSGLSNYSDAVRNNGGGFYNHNLYWKLISPGGEVEPYGMLKKAIIKEFGSVDQFKTKFSSAATAVFGSGWAWLINQDGKLKIVQSKNQDNPLMDVHPDNGYPLMAVDVWEHAYYLNYQNKRSDYIQALWKIINWNYVAEQYEKSMS